VYNAARSYNRKLGCKTARLLPDRRWQTLSFHANVLAIATGTGTQNTNLGNRFLYNAALSYRVFSETASEPHTHDPRNAYAHAGHDHSKMENKAPLRRCNMSRRAMRRRPRGLCKNWPPGRRRLIVGCRCREPAFSNAETRSKIRSSISAPACSIASATATHDGCFASAPAKRAEHHPRSGNFAGLTMPSLIANVTSHVGQTGVR
jgi:hypothetical protein